MSPVCGDQRYCYGRHRYDSLKSYVPSLCGLPVSCGMWDHPSPLHSPHGILLFCRIRSHPVPPLPRHLPSYHTSAEPGGLPHAPQSVSPHSPPDAPYCGGLPPRMPAFPASPVVKRLPDPFVYLPSPEWSLFPYRSSCTSLPRT